MRRQENVIMCYDTARTLGYATKRNYTAQNVFPALGGNIDTFGQNWFHNLQGPVQNETAGPLVKKIKNFKTATTEH